MEKGVRTDQVLLDPPARKRKNRVRVNAALYAAQLCRFGDNKSLRQGRRLHALIAGRDHDRDTYIGNLLIQMYGKCGSLGDAELAFHRIAKPNVFSFNLLIAAYLELDRAREALDAFDRMLEEDRVRPDAYTFSIALRACCRLRDLARGAALHRQIESSSTATLVLHNSLLDMYSKCGSADRARQLFGAMPHRDLVSWNTMLAAYARLGHSTAALDLYRAMLEQGVECDDFTYTTVLNACSRSNLSSPAPLLQSVAASPSGSSAAVGNAAVQALARWRSLASARKRFQEMGAAERSQTSWNSMIAALAEHGEAVAALDLFRAMAMDGVEPSESTITSLLGACSRSGTLDHAIRSFGAMLRDHSRMAPASRQYRAVVDVLGRAGWLEEAEDVVGASQELRGDAMAWLTLLGACSVHQDVGRAVKVVEMVIRLDGDGDAALAAFVLLSNILAARPQ